MTDEQKQKMIDKVIHDFDFEKVTVGGEKKEINWKHRYRFFASWQPGPPPCGLS